MTDGDERILNMRINNKDFLKGAADSLKAVDTLNKGIDSAGKGKGMTTLASGVDTVKAKFSALQVIGITALANIANRAVNAGINMVKSLTVAPIMDGWREYNKLLTSTQTIVANTGKTSKKGFAQVGQALDSLNHYSDLTIYNFGQMADNIGKFTAAGVHLNTATIAIKGLANSAALAGSDTNQLNTAMYQMSQALASGTIKLMDWNSLVNAGMGGKNMQRTLKATAMTLDGVSGKMQAAFKKAGNFRDSLREGWLTSDVFTKSMKVMAGQTLDTGTSLKAMDKLGLSKVTQSAIKAGGAFQFTTKDVENLKKRGFDPAQISALEAGKSIAYTTDQLKAMGYSTAAAKQLSKLSQSAIDSATKIKTFGQLLDVVKESIGSGWAQIFRRLFGDLKQSMALWTKVGNVVTGAVSNIFRQIDLVMGTWAKLGGYEKLWGGIGNIFKAIGNLLHPVVKMFLDMLPATKDAGNTMYNLTDAFYKFSDGLEKATRGNTTLGKIMQGVAGVLKVMIGIVGGVVKSYAELVETLWPIVAAVGRLAGAVADLLLGLVGLSSSNLNFGKIFNGLLEARQKVLEPLVKTIVGVLDALTELVKTGDVKEFANNFKNAFSNLSPFKGMAKDALAEGKKVATDIIAGIKQGWSSGDIQSTISSWVNNMLDFFKGLLGIHSPSTKFKEYGINIVQGLALGIAGALSLIVSVVSKLVTYLADQFKNMDAIDIAQLISTIFGGAVMVTILKFMNSLSKVMSTFKGFADIAKSALLGTLNQATKTMKTMQTGIRAKAILDIAIAIGILAASLWLMSKIPYDRLATGTIVVIALLNELNLMMQQMAKNEGQTARGIASITAMAAAMILISTAILILTGAVAIFGNMDVSTLVKGILAISVVMGILTGVAYVLGKVAPQMILASAGILILSVALAALAPVILLYASMKWSTIFSGMLKMAAALLILTVAMAGLAYMGGGLLVASAALVVLSIALAMLAGTIKLYASMKWSTIISGVAKIAAALIILGAAALVAAPGLVLLGVAALAIGAGLLMAGVGLALFGAGLAVVVAAGTAGIAVLATAFQAFLSMLPLIGTQIVAAFVSILEAIANAMPRIVDALVKIGSELIRGFNELSPKIIDMVVDLIKNLITGLASIYPTIAQAGLDLIQALLDAIDDHLPELLQTGVDILGNIITGLGNAASDLVTDIAKAILDFLTAVDDAINTYEPQIIDMGKKIAKDLIKGLVAGLIPDPIRRALRVMVDGMVNFFKGLLGIHSPSTVFQGFGKNIVQGLVNGIKNTAKSAWNAITDLVNKIPGLLTGAVSKVSSAAAKLGKAVLTGIKNGLSGAVSAVGNLSGSLLRGIKSALNSALNLPFHIPHLSIKIGPKSFGIGGQTLIPRFAKGVTGFRGGAALVGEVGPELVTMGRGSNVITNKTLSKFITQASRLMQSMASKSGASNSSGGTVQYTLSAGMSGDPESSGLQFATNLALGLIQGLQAKQPAVDTAMAGVGNSLMDTFTDLLGIHSPSKVYEEYAGYLSQGFINGLLASIDLVEKAAKAMGDSAILGISQSISDGQIQLETVRGEANAYSEAADALREKADATKNKKSKTALQKQAAELDKKAKEEDKKAQEQADKVDAENAAQQRAADFANADTQGKADMRKEDAVKAAQDASAAREKAAKLQKEADILRKTDATKAAELDKEAADALKQSQDLATQSEQYAKEAYDLNEQAKTEIDDVQAQQVTSITADDVALAQAQFDAYNKLLADAQQAAIDDAQPAQEIKFEQNNYSPEALSPSDTYRNGKSLIAVAEQKLLQPT